MHKISGEFDDNYETNIVEGHIKYHSNINYFKCIDIFDNIYYHIKQHSYNIKPTLLRHESDNKRHKSNTKQLNCDTNLT